MNYPDSQKGISLYFALLILSLNLSIVLGLTVILIDEIEMNQSIGHAVMSFYAADSGIEKVMVERNNPEPTYYGFFDLDNSGGGKDNEDSEYNVTVTPRGAGCNADNYCVKSIGSYKGTKRAIKVVY